MVKSARLVNLILAGMLTGNEFGGWVAVHPALGSLPASEHIRAEQAVYRRYGKIMPFFMTSTIVSAIPVLSLTGDRKSSAFRFTLSGTSCFVAMLLITLAGNVPINRRLLDLPPQEASYREFLELRKRWDRLHTLRNLLNIAGLSFSCLGALSQAGPGDAA
ncbi:MAG: DUF1772 domain-containing protein [Rubrobacter sp.]|nr:DUF1772 domain-containing protein [Rubrobacter sp.]